jgi:ferrous iron transport protein B
MPSWLNCKISGKGRFNLPPRLVGVKLLEGDTYVRKIVRRCQSAVFPGVWRLWDEIAGSGRRLAAGDCGQPLSICECDHQRRGAQTWDGGSNTTDQLDRFLTHRYLGLPIFAAIMFVVFQLTFAIGQDLLGDLMATGMGAFGSILESVLVNAGAPDWLIDFTGSGIIAG